VASVKAINLASGIPLVSVPTLDVIAQNFADEQEKALCPVVDAKKNKIYACFYGPDGHLKRRTDYLLTDVASLLKMIDRPTLLFGDAVPLYKDSLGKNSLVTLSKRDWLPRAEVVAEIGIYKAERREFADPGRLVPMYLHSQYCQVSSKELAKKHLSKRRREWLTGRPGLK